MSVKSQGSAGLFTPPLYSQLYRLTTVAEANDKGKWFGWEIEHIGAVEDMGVYEAAKRFAKSVKSGDVKVKHQDEAEFASGKEPF